MKVHFLLEFLMMISRTLPWLNIELSDKGKEKTLSINRRLWYYKALEALLLPNFLYVVHQQDRLLSCQLRPKFPPFAEGIRLTEP